MRPGARALLVLTALLVLVEGLGALAVAVLLVVQLATARPESLASAIALLVLALVLAAGLIAAAIGLLRRRAWTRAVVVVWQLLQLAVGVSALTGIGSRPFVGWPLIALAVILIVLIFTPPVVAATQERRERG